MRRVLLTLPCVAVALVSTSAQGTADRLGLSSLANAGRGSIAVGAAMRAELERAGAEARGRVLAHRNGAAFVEFTRAAGGNCYGIRKRDAARFAFTCWSDFPSAAHPILDQSVFGANVGEPIHLIEAQGFAADGVAGIRVEDSAGATIARVPVVDNVYRIEDVPQSAVRLVAVAADGRALSAVPR